MDKHYEAFKEILEDQIKRIAKKGDITPQELDNVYKASAIVLDFETKEAMKKAEEQSKGQGQSQSQGQSNNQSGYSQEGSYNRGSYDNSNRGSYEHGQSNHYPWFMYYQDGGRNMSNRGNSYAAIWNKETEPYMGNHPMSNNSMDRGVSNEYSRNNSYNTSYEGAYDGAYDGSYNGAYDGAYDGSYDNSNENSYRRGRDQRTGRYVSRDRGYSRAMDKQRMIGKLEDMMDDASSEKERRALQQCVEKLERQ